MILITRSKSPYPILLIRTLTHLVMVTVTVDLTEVPVVVEDDAGNGRIKVVHILCVLCSLDVRNIDDQCRSPSKKEKDHIVR